MSKPDASASVMTRYRFDPDGLMEQDNDGPYVLYDEAMAELERLASEVARSELDVQRAREVRNSEADARIAAEAELARAREANTKLREMIELVLRVPSMTQAELVQLIANARASIAQAGDTAKESDAA